jgi:hypothetical protein
MKYRIQYVDRHKPEEVVECIHMGTTDTHYRFYAGLNAPFLAINSKAIERIELVEEDQDLNRVDPIIEDDGEPNNDEFAKDN